MSAIKVWDPNTATHVFKPVNATVQPQSQMEKATYIEKTDVGATLCTWVYCCFQLLYYAERVGRKAYINWPQKPSRALQPHFDLDKFRTCPNMYEWWFKQPQFDVVPDRGETWVCEQGPPLGDFNLFNQPLSFIRAYYQKNLVFNGEIAGRINQLAAKYNIDFNNTLAVAWRGCDSYVDGRPRMPIETYFPFIDDILAKDPDLKIFATAEETTVAEKVAARYPGRTFTISELFSAPWGYTNHSEYVNPASGYERGVQTCQLLGILSRCKYLIKNRSSMSATASWLSHGKIINLAHPENLGFGFDITKAEIDGQIMPLNR